MSFRILKIGGAYIRFLNQFYNRQPEIRNAPYSTQYRRYMNECIDWSDFYAHNLELFDQECIEIIATAELLQKQWAREHDISYDEQHWKKQILTAQIKYYKPDILFWSEIDLFDQSFRKIIRNNNPLIKMHIGFKCSPMQDYNSVRDLDMMLTCIPSFVKQFELVGVKTALLRHGFEKTIIDRVGYQEKKFDFTFTGSLGSVFHTKRNDLVEDLLQDTSLQVWSFIKATDQRLRPKRDNGILITSLMKFPPSIVNRIPILQNITTSARRQPMHTIINRFPDRVHDEVVGLEMYRLLAQSKITLNVHVDISGNDAGSMRLFEATGMGTLLLTDQKDNIQTLFEPGKEVLVYRSVRECCEMVNYYLDHEEEREAIARAGQQRTLHQHTYYHRAQEFVDIIQQYISNHHKK